MTRTAMLAASALVVFASASPSQARNCELFGNLKSVDTRQPITITFVNTSGMFRHIDWIDYNGNPVAYQALNPGQSYVQQTFVGHPWMTTDGPGNCIDIFIPKRSRTINLR